MSIKPIARKRKPLDPLTDSQRELAVRYLPLAKSLAKPLKRSWPNDRDEFDSAAMLALVHAARTFDPSREVKFSTYARYWIRGALRDVQRALIPHGFTSDIPNAPHLVSLFSRAEEYVRVYGCAPDRPVGHELETTEFVENCFQKLPARHAEACREIYFNERNTRETAEAMGCSKSRVTTLHQESLERINESWAYKTRRESYPGNLAKRPTKAL